jgi:hypothetical protein
MTTPKQNENHYPQQLYSISLVYTTVPVHFMLSVLFQVVLALWRLWYNRENQEVKMIYFFLVAMIVLLLLCIIPASILIRGVPCSICGKRIALGDYRHIVDHPLP